MKTSKHWRVRVRAILADGTPRTGLYAIYSDKQVIDVVLDEFQRHYGEIKYCSICKWSVKSW